MIDSSIIKYKKILLPSRSGRQNELESDCVEVETLATQAASTMKVGRVRIRPKDNKYLKRAQKIKIERCKHQTSGSKTMQLATTTMQLVATTKWKANIMEN